MIGIILALLTAVTHAGSAVLIRKRIDESNFLSVAIVTSIIGNIILWPLAFLFTDFGKINLNGIIFFAIAGAFAPGLSRLLLFQSMERIGVSVSRTIFSIYPIYSVTFGFFLFQEILSLQNLFGIFLVIFGVVAIERTITNSKNKKNISKRDLYIPLIASLAVAFSHLVRKHGLNIYNEQLFGVAIGYLATLLIYSVVLNSHTFKKFKSVSTEDFKLFWLASVFLVLAWILAFYALSFERISIVTPLMQTQPLFILFFAYLYLRKREPLSFKLVLSTIFVVIGVMLVII